METQLKSWQSQISMFVGRDVCEAWYIGANPSLVPEQVALFSERFVVHKEEFEGYVRRHGLAGFPPLGASEILPPEASGAVQAFRLAAAQRMLWSGEWAVFLRVVSPDTEELPPWLAMSIATSVSEMMVTKSLLDRLPEPPEEAREESYDAYAGDYVRRVRPQGIWRPMGDEIVCSMLSGAGDIDPMRRITLAQESFDLEMYRSRLLVGDAPLIEDPADLENVLASYMESLGFEVSVPAGTGDQGADVLAERSGVRVVIQAKLWSKPAGNKAVQEVISAGEYYGCNVRAVVSPSGFTSGAIDLARQTGVHLVDGDALDAMLDGRWTFL